MNRILDTAKKVRDYNKAYGVKMRLGDTVFVPSDEKLSIESPRNLQIGGSHYVDMKIQPWDAMKVWLTPEQYIGYHKGAIIGYIARCDAKGGSEDIRKAGHHMEELLAYLRGDV